MSGLQARRIAQWSYLKRAAISDCEPGWGYAVDGATGRFALPASIQAIPDITSDSKTPDHFRIPRGERAREGPARSFGGTARECR